MYAIQHRGMSAILNDAEKTYQHKAFTFVLLPSPILKFTRFRSAGKNLQVNAFYVTIDRFSKTIDRSFGCKISKYFFIIKISLSSAS